MLSSLLADVLWHVLFPSHCPLSDPYCSVHDIMSSEAGPFQAIRGESGRSDITYVFI